MERIKKNGTKRGLKVTELSDHQRVKMKEILSVDPIAYHRLADQFEGNIAHEVDRTRKGRRSDRKDTQQEIIIKSQKNLFYFNSEELPVPLNHHLNGFS